MIYFTITYITVSLILLMISTFLMPLKNYNKETHKLTEDE